MASTSLIFSLDIRFVNDHMPRWNLYMLSLTINICYLPDWKLCRFTCTLKLNIYSSFRFYKDFSTVMNEYQLYWWPIKFEIDLVWPTIKSATHQKTPTQNIKGSEDNTDDRKIQGQHKRQAPIWTSNNFQFKYVDMFTTKYIILLLNLVKLLQFIGWWFGASLLNQKAHIMVCDWKISIHTYKGFLISHYQTTVISQIFICLFHTWYRWSI